MPHAHLPPQPQADDSDLLVEVRALHAGYGAHAVLHGVDLTLRAGERLAVVGGSGSGKTTLARSLLGLLPGAWLRAERLRVGGVEVPGAAERDLARLRGGYVGLAFQDPLATLDPLQRVGAALVETARAHGAAYRSEARARALALLAQVELPDPERIFAAYPHQVSGGQRQRVGLALALAGRPRVLVADEPTSSLDPPLGRAIARLLVRLTTGPGAPALLLVSHDMLLVRAVCERALVLADGRAVEAGAVEDLVARPTAPATRTLLAAAGLVEPALAQEAG